MTRHFTLLLALVLAAGDARAQTSVDDLGKKLVHDFLTEVITLESRFDQSLMDAEGNIVESNSGTLEIERPTRFRWSYIEPYEQWLVADGLNIWSYDLDLEQVTVKPQAEALANTPALLLGGSENALEQFDFSGTTIEEFTTWVRLEPKNKDSGFDGVVLGFMEGQLRRMMFFDNLEQTTMIALHDVRVNEPIDDERFEFVVPVGVDLVGTPATAISEEP
ncbi:MAG: outer membrane lipoprotein chaperone LolA [Woeseiaceae bacterium]|nr:outer membrane lipoprotein chaperone LolA [Woeseiaceae bacterium]